MASFTLTRNLKLRLVDNMTADAIYNLQRIDALASVFQIDSNSDVNVRSVTDIHLIPQDPVIQGSGTGGIVSIGTVDQPVGHFNVYADATNIAIPSSNITGILPVANGGTGVASSTGSGAVVLYNSPNLLTPFIGAATATSINLTTIPASSTLVTTSNTLAALSPTSSSALAGIITDETGSGSLVFANSPTLITPVLGAATATSINGTSIPSSSTILTTANNLSSLSPTTSAQLAGIISDETGSGPLVFASSPTLVTPNLGTPSVLIGTNISGMASSFTSGDSAKVGGITVSGTPALNYTLVATSTTAATWQALAGNGTVRSVDVSGGTTGLTTSGGPITLDGTITLSGTLSAANGGTGITSLGTGVATFLSTPSSANLRAAVTDETGSGALVFATSPTLVTPDLGTPSALVGTNISGTAASLTAGHVTTNANLTGAITSSGNATSLGSFSSANLSAALTDETGTGSAVFSNAPVLVIPNLGTPSTLVGTNITGTASGLTAGNVTTNADLTGAITSSGNSTSLGSFSSANLSSALTDETGTGSAVFATSPVLVTPNLGTPSTLVGTNISGTGASFTAGHVTTNANLTGAITSVGNATSLGSFESANLATALTDETGSGSVVFSTSPVLVTPNLGTPSTLVGTNITGTAASFTAGTVTTNANLTGVITSSGNATSLGSFSSANLLAALTTKTGTGNNVFATSPSLLTPTIVTSVLMKAQAPIIFNNAADTFSTTFSGGNVASNLTFTLPITAGSANQVIKTDGSGVLGWATVLSNPMTTTGDVIYSSDNSGTAARLAIGNTSQRLGVAAGIPAWSNTITGASDIVQEKILGNATQTSNIFEVQKSDATSLFAVTNTAGTKIRGTTTNTTVAAGFVGEIITSGSVGTGITVTTSPKTIGSIALTAGNWEITALAQYNGGATNTYYQAYIGGTVDSSSGTTFGLDKGIGMVIAANGLGNLLTISKAVSISATTTYYLTCETPAATAGSSGILGVIYATRIV